MRDALNRPTVSAARRHSLPALALRSLQDTTISRQQDDGALSDIDTAFIDAFVSSQVRVALRTVGLDDGNAQSDGATSSDDVASTVSSTLPSADCSAGRETPPPRYDQIETALLDTPARPTAPRLGQVAPLAASARRAAARRNDLLALAARRGEDLAVLDPPPSYEYCMGEASDVVPDALAEYARTARALNRGAAQQDLEAMLGSQRHANGCCSRLCGWIPLLVIVVMAFGATGLSVVYGRR